MKIKNNHSDLVFINPNVKNIYDIQTTNKIQCSPLHRFFTLHNFSIVEKEAHELKDGDFILQAGIVDIQGQEQSLPSVITKRIATISKNSSLEVEKRLQENNCRKKICEKIGITPRQLRRVLHQSYPTSVHVLHNLRNNLGLQLEMNPVYTYKHRNIILPSVMNQELAQICGYFLGDGNLEHKGLRFRDARFEVLECYKNLFKRIFNIEGTISKMRTKNCFNLDINSREIADLFKLIMPHVLDIIGKSKNDVVKCFIKGFVDAEGHIDKKRPKITIAQKEKQILRYIQLFLLRFGVRSFLREDVGKKKINNLSIRDRSLREYLDIGFSASDKQDTLLFWIQQINKMYDKEMMPIARKELWNLLKDVGLMPSLVIKSRSKNYQWINRRELKHVFTCSMNKNITDRQIKQKIDFIRMLLDSDFRFEKIRKITVRDNTHKELLYDFSVPALENYIANGFVVHNSTYRIYVRRGKKSSRVAKLIDSPNLPDNECVFYISEKGVIDGGEE